jgi:hypothetical protein
LNTDRDLYLNILFFFNGPFYLINVYAGGGS